MGYDDDIDPNYYQIRDIETHRDSAIYKLKSIIRMYQISIELLS